MALDSLAQHEFPRLQGHLAVIEHFLPEPLWSDLLDEASRLAHAKRSYLPTHKMGGTVAYETLERQAPGLVAFYRSRAMRRIISRIAGQTVWPTPLHDQSSCSVLFYNKPGDHIGWHYDHNFYRGRHFTVLLAIINRGHGPDGLSAARLMARQDGSDKSIPTPPNTLVVFEGAKLRHKVTPIAEGERRVIWSMTYCSDSRNSAWQGIARRIKDTAFFGIRALWT